MAKTHRTLLALLVTLAGCTTTGAEPGEELPPLLYPLPPATARIQYLGSFSDSRDVEAPQGALLDFVAGNEQEIRVLKKPFGVGFTPDGFPVAVDMKQDCLAVFDLRNGVFEQDYPAGGAVLERPLALCYGPDGERYVADGTRQVVIVTDPSGTFVRTLGDPASLKVGGIAASAAFVFVGDLGAREVEVYDRKSGVLVRTFAGEGEEALGWPVGLACTPAGDVVVSDTLKCRVRVFSPEGELKLAFGMNGRELGNFARPKGVACDRDGRIYVVDAAFQNVQVFNAEGELLLPFGGPGNRGELSMPVMIAISYDHLELYQDLVAEGYELDYVVAVTSQFGPNRINLYGFLRQEKGGD